MGDCRFFVEMIIFAFSLSERENQREWDTLKNKLMWPNVSDIILGFLA